MEDCNIPYVVMQIISLYVYFKVLSNHLQYLSLAPVQ